MGGPEMPISQARSFALPRLALTNGTVEALKWIALVLMTIDHVNKYLLNGSVPAMFAAGRVSLPLFTFVLAYNLARPGSLANAARVYPRTLLRLAGAAAVATVPFMALGGLAAGWWPLNILATFSVAVAAMYLLLLGGAWRKTAAITLILVCGGFVEFWWPAIGMCLAAWYYCRRPSWPALTLWVASTLALNLNGWAFGRMPIVNASMWALVAFLLIFMASQVRLHLPRIQWVFYAYFPAHLVVLWLLQHDG